MSYERLKNKIDKYEFVDIYIKYDLGGVNHFDYKTLKRGYYIHFQPVNVRNDKFGMITETEIFHKRSFKYLLKEVKRKNTRLEHILMELFYEHKKELVDAYEVDNQTAVNKVVEIFGDSNE